MIGRAGSYLKSNFLKKLISDPEFSEDDESSKSFIGVDTTEFSYHYSDSREDDIQDTSSQSTHLPHYLGHRKRLKERFLNSPSGSLSDYELLELLLFQSIPRRDVKPLAKDLLAKFGNFGGLIAASMDKFSEIPTIKNGTYIQFKLINEILSRVLKHDIHKKNILSSWSSVLNYLKFSMGSMKLEQFRILFLNKKNILLADEVMASGTIDQTPVYPREVVKKALFYEAGAIILVHNHPSGDAQPSQSDISLTKEIVSACAVINVKVHDHVIMSKNGYYSFKSNMLL